MGRFILSDVCRYIVHDYGRTHQIIANLLGNAVKFISEGRVIAPSSLSTLKRVNPSRSGY